MPFNVTSMFVFFSMFLFFSMFVFFGFFNKATAYYTLERIFTQNSSKDVVPGNEVPFGGHDAYI